MDQIVSKSIHATIRQAAKNEVQDDYQKPMARLTELQRPVTRDQKRNLFDNVNPDYQNRPPSAIKDRQFAEVALKEFYSETNMTNETTKDSRGKQALPDIGKRPKMVPVMPVEQKKQSFQTFSRDQIKGGFDNKKRN